MSMDASSRRPRGLVVLAAALMCGLVLGGCAQTPPPVRPWQRGYLAKRALQFNDGLEARFRQPMFASREGAEGGYGFVGGGCGCN
jgi:hypothetical protein